MMYPILCKVKYETLHRVLNSRGLWIQIAFSLAINWIIAPLVMVRILRDLQTKDGYQITDKTLGSLDWPGHSCLISLV